MITALFDNSATAVAWSGVKLKISVKLQAETLIVSGVASLIFKPRPGRADPRMVTAWPGRRYKESRVARTRHRTIFGSPPNQSTISSAISRMSVSSIRVRRSHAADAFSRSTTMCLKLGPRA